MVARLGSRGVPSRTDGLIGRQGVVTHDIEATVGAGRVNVGGEDWAARAAAPLPAGTRIRIGGLVKEGSVQRGSNLQVRFEVTDGKTSIPVHYQGILPDLFREGQGVVAEGKLEPDKVVDADTVLAKHDERYMPKEVADSLKAKGVWQDETARPGS